jgi:predicted metal-dependent enzyme (double-stranded beta helix superfamily)
MIMAVATLSGCEALCQALDQAIGAKGDTHELTGRVESALKDAIRDRGVTLPDNYCRTLDACYARRLVHKSPQLGYTVLAMVWGPAQGTPLHDHCGMWCVEAVLEGNIDVRQYELMESDGDRFRFEERGEVRAGVGSAGSLIPPFEYHTMTNASAVEPAITLHVYGGELIRSCVFHEAEVEATGGRRWYTQEQRELHYTE